MSSGRRSSYINPKSSLSWVVVFVLGIRTVAKLIAPPLEEGRARPAPAPLHLETVASGAVRLSCEPGDDALCGSKAGSSGRSGSVSSPKTSDPLQRSSKSSNNAQSLSSKESNLELPQDTEEDRIRPLSQEADDASFKSAVEGEINQSLSLKSYVPTASSMWRRMLIETVVFSIALLSVRRCFMFLRRPAH